MEDSRKKAFRQKGYKPFWESEEEPEEPAKSEAPVVPDDADTNKYKLVRGLMRKGLSDVLKKK